VPVEIGIEIEIEIGLSTTIPILALPDGATGEILKG